MLTFIPEPEVVTSVIESKDRIDTRATGSDISVESEGRIDTRATGFDISD